MAFVFYSCNCYPKIAAKAKTVINPRLPQKKCAVGAQEEKLKMHLDKSCRGCRQDRNSVAQGTRCADGFSNCNSTKPIGLI